MTGNPETVAGFFSAYNVVNLTRYPMSSLSNLPERLKKHKEDRSLTYDELGKTIGVSKAIAYDICNNRRRFLSLEVVEKILKLLEV